MLPSLQRTRDSRFCHDLAGANPAQHVFHYFPLDVEVGHVPSHVLRPAVPQHLQLGAIHPLDGPVAVGPVEAHRRILEELPDLALASRQVFHRRGRFLRRLLRLGRRIAGLDRLVLRALPLLVRPRRLLLRPGRGHLGFVPQPQHLGGRP